MRSALPQFDADRKGAVTFEEFKDKMQMLFDEFLLAEEDTIELFRFFDNDGVGQITFDEFCKAVTSSYTPGMAAILEVDVLSPMDSGTLEKYVQHVHLVELSGRQEAQLEKALRLLGSYVDELRNEKAWAAPFLSGDPIHPETGLHSGKIASSFFAQVLREKAHLTERDLDVVKVRAAIRCDPVYCAHV